MTDEKTIAGNDPLVALTAPVAGEEQKPKKQKKMRKMTVGSVIGLIFTYLFLIIVALIVVTPIIYIVLMAFNAQKSMYLPTIFPTKYSVDAFVRLFEDTDFLIWYGNTLLIGAMNAVACLILVLPTSYALSRLRFKGRKNYLMIFLVLQMFPGTMVIIADYVLLNMLNLLDSYFGLVIVYSCTAVPGSTFMMKGYFDTIPREIEEAAMLDGASRFQCVMRIMVPLAKPMVGLIALFGFTTPFGDYMLSSILLSDPDKFTLAIGIYHSIFSQKAADYAMFAAASLLSALPIIIIYMSLQKIIINGLGGATK